jgi:hypothetical protein
MQIPLQHSYISNKHLFLATKEQFHQYIKIHVYLKTPLCFPNIDIVKSLPWNKKKNLKTFKYLYNIITNVDFNQWNDNIVYYR